MFIAAAYKRQSLGNQVQEALWKYLNSNTSPASVDKSDGVPPPPHHEANSPQWKEKVTSEGNKVIEPLTGASDQWESEGEWASAEFIVHAVIVSEAEKWTFSSHKQNSISPKRS